MAKKLITSYTFTPGVSGAGTVAIAGTYTLEQFLLITNVVDNIVIYEFDVNTLGGTVSTGGGNTTLALTYDTSGMSSGDRLQIFIDDGQNPTVSVSGTVTANAGTNLNTSALALESGGNLASINTKLPAQGSAQPSASLPITLPNKVVVTGPSGQSALNTNLLTGNLSDWSDAQGYSSVLVNVVQSAGISAGTFTFEGSPDGTQVVNLQYTGISTASGNLLTGNVTMVANSMSSHFAQIPYRYWRVRISTAATGGSVQAIATYSNALQMPIGQSVVTPSGVNLSTNIAQIIGQTPVQSQINGSTSVGLGVIPVAGNTATEYTTQNVAAVSGSLANNATSANSPSWTFDINLTTFSAGSSTGLDLYLQESPDNGTTFYDIWQVEALTAAGRARIPALSINGRRRIRWVNRTGAATTATLTVTSMGTPAALPTQRQFFDRTSGVGSGTAVLNTNSAAYDIAGCKQISVVMQAGTSTTMGTFQVQMSLDGTNWYAASVATAIGAITANNTVIPVTSGMSGRFIRVTCTNAGTAQVINAIHIYATS